MESLISTISKLGLDTMMDVSRDELIAKDEEYRKLEKEMSDLEFVYSKIKLDEEQGKVIKDYVHILNYIRAVYGDISYAAGVRDTVLLLNSLGLLKGTV